MTPTTLTNDTQTTMSSLELVEYINTERRAAADAAGAPFPSKGFAKLEHGDLLKKVQEVLGDHAGNFSGMVLARIGSGAFRESACYNFPKREACLMAMSYSYDLQAKVYDRMEAVETKLREIQHQQMIEAQVSQRLVEAKPEFLKQIKAEYHEQCLHSEEYELGKAVIQAMQSIEDRRNKAKMDAAVLECTEQVVRIMGEYGVEFQALVTAVSKARIDLQAKARDARGEHLSEEDESLQRNLRWAKSAVDRMGNLVPEVEKPKPLTIDDILAHEAAHKHDHPSTAQPVTAKRTRRRK